jgi:hypothetical protein
LGTAFCLGFPATWLATPFIGCRVGVLQVPRLFSTPPLGVLLGFLPLGFAVGTFFFFDAFSRLDLLPLRVGAALLGVTDLGPLLAFFSIINWIG